APLGARLRRATDVRRTSGAQKLRGVRTEEGEWVRFARGDVRRRPAAGGAGAWVLEVASYDGRFSGSAEVDAIVGVHPRPVRIELRPRSVLRGRATVAGEGVSGVSVTLRRADGIDGAWSDRSFKDGTFELRWLEPGPHTLTAVSQRFDPLVREVFVEPGEGGRVELRLSPKTVAGEVRGVLRSRTGAFGRGGKAEGALQRVALRSTEGTGWRTETIVHWSETPEGSVGEFTFPDVPRGSYAVTPAPFRYLSWEPSSLAIEPPAAGLEFVLADGGGVGDLALVARDAADGRALSGTVLHLVALGRELSFDDLAPGAVFLRGWPGESAFSWTVECPGYAPRSGSSSTFSDSPDPAGPRTLAVSLERGWGATFVAVGLDDLEVESPLSGVEVRLDGEPVGVTDAAGRLAARAPRRPTRAALSLAGWRLLDGDLAPDGSFTPRRARVTARFTRLR
ncbi:MAG: carboxypeptidase-like regulatory domain-containing protein, partial [Planctomycetota bacterium]|nr:carboxypeptidase-like regulatory domain-containing protein [Planctomycetota bacterium]